MNATRMADYTKAILIKETDTTWTYGQDFSFWWAWIEEIFYISYYIITLKGKIPNFKFSKNKIFSY